MPGWAPPVHVLRACSAGREEQGGGWVHTSPGSVLAALRAPEPGLGPPGQPATSAERRSLVPENWLLRVEALPGILFQLILHEKHVHALLLHPKPPSVS